MRWLRLVSLSIFALLAIGAANAAGRSDIVDFYTGNQLFDFCQGGSPACVGYILGVAAARNGDSFCFPAGVIAEQVVSTVKLWLNNHPEKRHLPGGLLVMQALSESFPCN
jgi:Rap1a immunity proteins